jgi:2,4-dienoyl-CoA reductase-like NADH-dependent reductase (Old Yellow Enzyme family)
MKGAMSEALATADGIVTAPLLRLYDTWGQGGLGCSITGNVMIDQRAKNEPGVVVIEDERDLPALKAWAAIGKKYNMVQIVQLSHPGKQCPRGLNKETVAPSAIGFAPEMSAVFGTPRELREDEIYDLIRRFGESARICKKAGFEGVQIHGAHGYLVSEFLSPKHNQRTDQWGGSLENRMRFVLEAFQRNPQTNRRRFYCRGSSSTLLTSKKAGLAKTNQLRWSKPWMRWGVDFIEISGGTYEAPAMTGVKQSTRAA